MMVGTQWNSNDYASGGLQLSYCLNNTHADAGIGSTSSCGCDVIPPDPSSCIALTDYHNGRYGGALNGRYVLPNLR